MGKKSHIEKDRVCMKCEHTITCTSKELRDHAKRCKGAK